ncbi:hypothetical protein [Sphingobium yanoikuyae]|uniref:hypothetical protein n=1 Tax=Sphingobium yanoikuyae TaxID=13690 RepID=UPI00244AC76E|nr:hypothetical protein [Sphingobium yanoikuyae]MDH2153354.1 hypothetical protein [Sphingobium yanoikuyae]
MKRAPRSRQRHDLYAKYHDYDSEISDLLGECGLQQFPMQQCVIAQLVTKRAKCADCQPAHMLWQQRSD